MSNDYASCSVTKNSLTCVRMTCVSKRLYVCWSRRCIMYWLPTDTYCVASNYTIEIVTKGVHVVQQVYVCDQRRTYSRYMRITFVTLLIPIAPCVK